MIQLPFKLVLGSQSPRRKWLLEEVGLEFELRPSHIDEVHPSDLPAEQVPEFLAKQKAEALLPVLGMDEVLLTADTIVLMDGKIYEKPSGREGAIAMLKALSGRSHTVISGLYICDHHRSLGFSVKTEVFFNELNEQDIEYYVDRFKPWDKAGAYAIQEWIGYIGIDRIEGDYYNVVGLPISRVLDKLRHFAEMRS